MQTFSVHGMHCASCKEKIETAFEGISGIHSVSVDREQETISIEATHELDPEALTQVVQKKGDYTITDLRSTPAHTEKRTLRTYAPLLSIFALIVLYALVQALFLRESVTILRVFRDLMTAFFVLFGVLEAVTLPSFSKTFASYDPIAKRLPGYALAYPFLLLLFGMLMYLGIWIPVVAALTAMIFAVQTYGIIPVIRSGESVQCACIGTAFALPLSWVTVVENMAMIVMATVMFVASLV